AEADVIGTGEHGRRPGDLGRPESGEDARQDQREDQRQDHGVITSLANANSSRRSRIASRSAAGAVCTMTRTDPSPTTPSTSVTSSWSASASWMALRAASARRASLYGFPTSVTGRSSTMVTLFGFAAGSRSEVATYA